MNVAIILPFGGECPYRLRALTMWRSYWRDALATDGYSLITATDHQQPWNMARATQSGISYLDSKPDVIVLTGADSFVPAGQLREAVQLAAEAPGYVRAFTHYRRLSKPASLAAMTWQDLVAAPPEAVEWESTCAASPGVGAITLDAWNQTGGYDPKFAGWGYEDMAWRLVHEALFGPWRSVPGTLTHHWHPADSTDLQRQRAAANAALYHDRYLTRAGNATDLLALRFAPE